MLTQDKTIIFFLIFVCPTRYQFKLRIIMIRSYIQLVSYNILLLIFIAACQQPQAEKKTTGEEGKVIQYSGENIITEDLIIPEGSVLNISPGTRLKLNDKVNIIIEGKIIDMLEYT